MNIYIADIFLLYLLMTFSYRIPFLLPIWRRKLSERYPETRERRQIIPPSRSMRDATISTETIFAGMITALSTSKYLYTKQCCSVVYSVISSSIHRTISPYISVLYARQQLLREQLWPKKWKHRLACPANQCTMDVRTVLHRVDICPQHLHELCRNRKI